MLPCVSIVVEFGARVCRTWSTTSVGLVVGTSAASARSGVPDAVLHQQPYLTNEGIVRFLPVTKVDASDSCDSQGSKTMAPEGPIFTLLARGLDLVGLNRFEAQLNRLSVGLLSSAGDALCTELGSSDSILTSGLGSGTKVWLV